MDEILKQLAEQGINITKEELEAKRSAPVAKKVISADKLRSVLETKGFNNKKGLALDVADNGAIVGSLPFGLVDVKAMDEDKGGDARESFRASAKDMEKLKKVSKALASYPIYCFNVQAADSDVDRGYEHFNEKALAEMAELAIKNRIPYLITSKNNMCGDHDWKMANTYGKVFDAWVEQRKGGGFNLIYRMFIPEMSMTKDVLDGVFTTLYDKVSVGFSLNYQDFTCDICKDGTSIFDEDECPHTPGGTYDGKMCTATIRGVNDNFEFSGVAVPMQPKAQVRLNGLANELESDLVAKSFNRDFTRGGVVSELLSLDEIKAKGSLAAARERMSELTSALDLAKNPESVGKIINDVDTIKDNRDMDPETEATIETKELKTPEVAESVIEKDDLLVTENCKSRVEGMIEKAVTPLLAAIEANKATVDLSEVLSSIKSLKEDTLAELTKVQAELATLKGQVEKAQATLDVAKNLVVPATEKVLEPKKAEEISEDRQIMGLFGY